MATHFASLGAKIYICGRRENVLRDTANEISSKYNSEVLYQPLDIRASSDVDAYIAEIFNEQPLDGLVNNAAGNFISPTEMLSPNAFKTVIDIVLMGTWNCISTIGKEMIKNKKLKLFIEHTFSIEDFDLAYQSLDSRKVSGKILIKIK